MASAVVLSNPVYVPGAAGGEDGRSHAPSAEGGASSAAPFRAKSSLVAAAEAIDRRTALLSGYLRKKNSQNKWQKRYFEILGNYWVYYKSASSSEILCAMDLWKAGTPELLDAHSTATGDDVEDAAEFAITWDRYRLFRAATHAEAVRWVNAILQVQSSRPPDMASPGDKRGMPLPGAPRGGSASIAGSTTGSAALDDGAREWGAPKDGTPRTPKRTRSDEPEGGVCSSCVLM